MAMSQIQLFKQLDLSPRHKYKYKYKNHTTLAQHCRRILHIRRTTHPPTQHTPPLLYCVILLVALALLVALVRALAELCVQARPLARYLALWSVASGGSAGRGWGAATRLGVGLWSWYRWW